MSHPQPAGQAYGGLGDPQHAPAPGQGHAPMAAAGRQMKRRNPVGVWLGLPIITFGIYPIVWYVKIHSELAGFDPRHKVGTVSAVLSLFFGWITLGIWNLVVWIKLAGHINNAQRAAGLNPTCNGGLGFLLGILGFGALYYQLELNKVVGRYGDTQPGTQVPLAA
jgi:hypothetical protein